NVTAQDKSAESLTLVAEGNGAQREAHAARLDLASPRHPPRHDEWQGLVDEPPVLEQVRRELGERSALERINAAEPAERGHAVGARVLDDPLRIKTDEAVTHARSATTGPC